MTENTDSVPTEKIDNNSESVAALTKLTIPLNETNLTRMGRLVRWANVLGMITVVMGLLNLLSLISYKGHLLLLIPILGISVFLVFLGTRLTGGAAELRNSMASGSTVDFLDGIDRLKQYFMINTIVLILAFILIIFGLLAASVVGTVFDQVVA